jgi:hypothetical protein
MTNQIPPAAPASGPHPAPSGGDSRAREDAPAVSPVVGPLPPVYVPSAPGRESRFGLLCQAMAQAAREASDGPAAALGHLSQFRSVLQARPGLLAGDPTLAAWLARTALAADDSELAAGAH